MAGEVLVDRGVLPGEAHLLADGLRFAHDVVAEHRRRAGGGLEQRGEDADGGGLAGAVRAEQAVDGALADPQVHAVEGAGVAKVLTSPCVSIALLTASSSPRRGAFSWWRAPHIQGDRDPEPYSESRCRTPINAGRKSRWRVSSVPG